MKTEILFGFNISIIVYDLEHKDPQLFMKCFIKRSYLRDIRDKIIILLSLLYESLDAFYIKI